MAFLIGLAVVVALLIGIFLGRKSSQAAAARCARSRNSTSGQRSKRIFQSASAGRVRRPGVVSMCDIPESAKLFERSVSP